MASRSQPPRADRVAELPDVIVIWGATAALAGVIELDPHSNVLMATRSRQRSRWPGDRLVTTDPVAAVNFLRRRDHQ